MVKKDLRKKILVMVGCTTAILVLGFWIFKTFFFDDLLTSRGIPKIQKAVWISTSGRYGLNISRIIHSDGNMYLFDLELVRDHYDTSEHGYTIERLKVDTVRCEEVSWWDILRGKDLRMKGLSINAPKLFFVDADAQLHTPDTLTDTTASSSPLKIAKVKITDINAYLPWTSRASPAFNGMDVHMNDFYLDPEHPKNRSTFFSKHIDFLLPKGDFMMSDTFYHVQVINMRGNSDDSSLLIDSFSCSLRMSEDEFALRHRYATTSYTVRSSHAVIEGVSFSGDDLAVNKLKVGSWYFDTYLNRSRPANPHPPRAVMPNEFLSSLPVGISIDSLIFSGGKLRIRERSAISKEMGVLFFDRVNLAIAHLSTLDSNDGKPAIMNSTAYFVGEGLLRSMWIYALDRKSLDLDVNATITSFDAKKLNTWLVPIERAEVTSGELDNATIEMKVRSGVSTTSVTPRYHQFSMKVLNDDPKKHRGIMEGFKTFWSQTFVLHHDNPSGNKPVMIGTTTRPRAKDEEFMQFIWLSLRKSLGAVVGGFQ
jgi:hypothetical protein